MANDLEYSGGNPWDEDFGQIIEPMTGTQYVRFNANCFDADGAFLPEVLAAIRSLMASVDRDDNGRKVAT